MLVQQRRLFLCTVILATVVLVAAASAIAGVSTTSSQHCFFCLMYCVGVCQSFVFMNVDSSMPWLGGVSMGTLRKGLFNNPGWWKYSR